jgi:hypothetical protein
MSFPFFFCFHYNIWLIVLPFELFVDWATDTHFLRVHYYLAATILFTLCSLTALKAISPPNFAHRNPCAGKRGRCYTHFSVWFWNLWSNKVLVRFYNSKSYYCGSQSTSISFFEYIQYKICIFAKFDSEDLGIPYCRSTIVNGPSKVFCSASVREAHIFQSLMSIN